MRDIAELDFNKVATGDTKPNAWTLLDFGRFYSPFSFYRSIYAAILFLNHHPHLWHSTWPEPNLFCYYWFLYCLWCLIYVSSFTSYLAGDVVVHIFQPQQRTYYNLEEFYGNATPIELSFPPNSKSSYRSSWQYLVTSSVGCTSHYFVIQFKGSVVVNQPNVYIHVEQDTWLLEDK